MDKKKNVIVCPSDIGEPPVAGECMTAAELKREWQFFRASALAGRLLQAGLISKDEHRALMTENIKTFAPKLGALMDF